MGQGWASRLGLPGSCFTFCLVTALTVLALGCCLCLLHTPDHARVRVRRQVRVKSLICLLMVYPNWRDLRLSVGRTVLKAPGPPRPPRCRWAKGNLTPGSGARWRSLVSAGLGGPELAGEDTGRAWADCRAYRMPGAEARDVSPVVCVEANYESKIRWPVV